MNIVVLGGGTAGYISSLYFRKTFPDSKITIVDSSKYGAIGVGEGTNPNFIDLLKTIDIDVNDILLNASATIKNGIKFTGWGSSNDYYWHHLYDPISISKSLNSFVKIKNMPDSKFDNYLDFLIETNHNFSSAAAHAILEGGNLDSINPFSYLSENNLFIKSHHAIHFDAQQILLFLKSVAHNRNIDIVDDELKDVVFDSDGRIKSIVLSDHSLECDFVIDSSGINRLLIGKAFNSEWTDLSDTLPCDSAIAFWTKEDSINLYTEAIAMDYGWSWKIPTQERYGCGYVYDSSFISEEQAVEEIKSKFGTDIDIRKKINFKSGYFNTPLRKNCLALGLSSGFFEPLEATSLSIMTEMLKMVTGKEFIDIFYSPSQEKEDRFNKMFCELNEEVLAFIFLHYVTNKTNTDFWKNFTANNLIPKKIKMFLADMSNSLFSNVFGNKTTKAFAWPSWLTIYCGNELYNKELLYSLVDNNARMMYTDIVGRHSELIESATSFQKHINKIKQKGE